MVNGPQPQTAHDDDIQIEITDQVRHKIVVSQRHQQSARTLDENNIMPGLQRVIGGNDLRDVYLFVGPAERQMRRERLRRVKRIDFAEGIRNFQTFFQERGVMAAALHRFHHSDVVALFTQKRGKD